MASVSVRVDRELKRRMSAMDVNWSEHIREAIRRRVELEERKRMAERLVEGLEKGEAEVPRGFIDEAIRETRETR